VLSKCRNTPLTVARQLRQEANFGCARCAHPLIDNAHVIPYRDTKKFSVQDMVALCPNCHRMADEGQYPELVLRGYKANPRNKTHVSEAFLIMNNNLVVNIGRNRLVNTPKVITIDHKFDIISVKRGNDSDVLLDVNFYDKSNNLVAKISENIWTVFTQSIWDLVYKPRALTILNKPRDISLSLEIDKGEIFIKGTLYFNGFPIKITDNYIQAGIMKISGSSFENCINAVNINLLSR
jgi:hypothetical protein